MPTYLMISGSYILFIFLIGGDVGKTIWDFSLVSFIIEGNLSVWFIAAILALYMLFPLLFSISKHDYVAFGVITVIWFIVLGNAFLLPEGVLHKLNEVFFVRIPIFILGIVIARKEQDGSINTKIIGKKLAIIIFAVLILISYFGILRHGRNYWTIMRILFCPISLMFCVGISNLSIDTTTIIYKLIGNLGGITLEIYLMHERVLYWTHVLAAKIIHHQVIESIISNVFAVVVSIVAAYCISKVVTKLLGSDPIKKK